VTYGTMHFDAPMSEWTEKEVREFTNLMIGGEENCDQGFEFSSISQSKLIRLFLRSATPVDTVAAKVTSSPDKPRTCAVCGCVFDTVMERRSHQKSCRKEKQKLEKQSFELRNAFVNERLQKKWESED
jgi:hypothetical protein